MTIKIAPKALAAKIHAIITTYPKAHDQSAWGIYNAGNVLQNAKDVTEECGTTMCVAGWAAFLTQNARFITGNDDGVLYGSLLMDDDVLQEYGDWRPLGAKLLGLDADDAAWLFYSTDNRTAATALKWIAEGREIDRDAIFKESRELPND